MKFTKVASDEDLKDALNIRFNERDHDREMSIREYLKLILDKVWEDDECFNGKRPFGNSGWQDQVHDILAENGLMASTGYFSADTEAGKLVVRRMISLM